VGTVVNLPDRLQRGRDNARRLHDYLRSLANGSGNIETDLQSLANGLGNMSCEDVRSSAAILSMNGFVTVIPVLDGKLVFSLIDGPA